MEMREVMRVMIDSLQDVGFNPSYPMISESLEYVGSYVAHLEYEPDMDSIWHIYLTRIRKQIQSRGYDVTFYASKHIDMSFKNECDELWLTFSLEKKGQ